MKLENLRRDEDDLLPRFTEIIAELRLFWAGHAKRRKELLELYKNDEDAYRQVKGTKANGPQWYAVAKCDNCDGRQITDSSIALAKRWVCVTCGEICDIAWVEPQGRLKAMESNDKALMKRAEEELKPKVYSVWETKARRLHAKSVEKSGCKVRRMEITCEWCDDRKGMK